MEVTKQVFESSIKVNKGMLGEYGWEIKCYGDNVDKIMAEIDSINEKLKAKYPKGANGGIKA